MNIEQGMMNDEVKQPILYSVFDFYFLKVANSTVLKS